MSAGRPVGSNRPVLYAVRHRGYVELYDSPERDVLIAEWRLEDFQRYFGLLFPEQTPVIMVRLKAERARYACRSQANSRRMQSGNAPSLVST